jgi:O-antigen/teichoic acid export membrane protein
LKKYLMYDQAVVNTKIEEKPTAQAPALASGRQGFVVNVASNLAFTFVQAVMSLWYTPFLIRHLGIASFGIVPLVNSITSYVSLATFSFTSAVSRYLTIDLARRDERTANTTFNTALLGVAAVVLVLTPVVVGFSLAFPNIFHVPPGAETDARWQFLLVAIAFLISVLVSNFSISAYAHSKFLLINIVRFAELFARIGLVVILFSLLSAQLWHVGAGYLAAALVAVVGQVLLWRRLTPELRIDSKYFDRSRLRAMLSTGGWSMVERMGFMLMTNMNLLVVNLAFDATTTGGYGSLLQFPTLINSMGIATLTVLWPSIMKKYAQGDLTGLERLTSQAVKLTGLLTALPAGLLCGFSRPFLATWLGPSFQHLDLLLVLLVFHLSTNLSVIPLGYVENAYNKVRWPGIVTVLTGVFNLGLAILVARWGKWGVYGVALAAAISTTLRSAIWMPLYNAHIMRVRWWFAFPSLSAGAIGTLVVSVMAYAATSIWMPTGWIALGVSATIVSLVYSAGLFFWGLTRKDWQLIASLIPSPMSQPVARLLNKTGRI